MSDGKTTNSSIALSPHWMSDGNGGWMPVPTVMTQAELIRFFRIDETKTRFPENTLLRYRKQGLRAVQVGKQVVYQFQEVQRFLEYLREKNPR